MIVGVDFEFKRPNEPDMGLISVAIRGRDFDTERFWLWNGKDNQKFINRINGLKDHVLVGYSIQQAEARCFAALGLNPNDFKWRDLMLEWRWLRNGDNRFSYGKIIQNNFPRVTFPPVARVGKKASQEELDEAKATNDQFLSDIKAELDDSDETEVGLAEAGWSMLDCTYFFEVIGFTGYQDASATKKAIRDEVIIKGTDEDIEEYMFEILDYNSGDIQEIIELADVITDKMREVGEETHIMALAGDIQYMEFDRARITEIQLDIGDWAARLAKYGLRGIPLSLPRLNRLLEVVPKLVYGTQCEWNRDHPETPLYRIGLAKNILESRQQPAKNSPYIKAVMTKDADMMEAIIEAYCESSGLQAYPRTRSGKPDTSKKVIERYASGENILKQYQRHTGQLSALKTYSANKQGEVEALRYVGSDGRQRVDFGPYGTQTARNGAKAKSYCFLGPHWLRMLVAPEKGKAVVELDFGSQEVFIAGSISGDENMKLAYASNDVYMYYAQLTGMYPADLPIPTEDQRSEDWFKIHKKTRNIAKTLNLSMQFGAGAKSVAGAVRDATKDSSITDEMGSDWVSDYNNTYFDYSQMQKQVRSKYRDGYSLCLPSGWRMGVDNPSALSAGNLPVQGLGSCILQRACKLMDEAGLIIIATLHDAITLYCDDEDAEEVAKIATQIMKDASEYYLGEQGMKVGHAEIVRHGELWLHSDRAQSAWERLKINFEGTY
jgi:hypothetical protein